MIDNKTVFITGAGSLAKALTQELLLHHRPHKVILFSRDEYLQELAKEEIVDPKGIVRYFIGDVRDSSRLDLALRDVDIVVHTAALKRVDAVEYNPVEGVRTNIDGTINVVAGCVVHGIKRAVFVSTDKAVMPINLYGGTKFVSEKLWIASNFYKPIFNCVRYGNVMGSRGSILPLYEQCVKNRLPFPITDRAMTRFWVRIEDAVKLVLMAAESKEGYTYIFKSPTFRIIDLAKALHSRHRVEEIGMRPGEKLHETLIGAHETGRVEDRGWYYAIQPEIRYSDEEWPECKGMEPVVSSEGNVYRAEIEKWLS